MSDSATAKRQLTIKAGVVRRLTKEETVYRKEAEDQQARVHKYVSDGRDEWDVKNQQKVLQDCLQMIPDTRKRLEAATEDLELYLQGIAPDVTETAEAKAALEALSAAKQSAGS